MCFAAYLHLCSSHWWADCVEAVVHAASLCLEDWWATIFAVSAFCSLTCAWVTGELCFALLAFCSLTCAWVTGQLTLLLYIPFVAYLAHWWSDCIEAVVDALGCLLKLSSGLSTIISAVHAFFLSPLCSGAWSTIFCAAHALWCLLVPLDWLY